MFIKKLNLFTLILLFSTTLLVAQQDSHKVNTEDRHQEKETSSGGIK